MILFKDKNLYIFKIIIFALYYQGHQQEFLPLPTKETAPLYVFEPIIIEMSGPSMFSNEILIKEG